MLPPPPPELLGLIEALPAAGQLLERLDGRPGVHLVGGTVRDVLVGREPLDLDVLVEDEVYALARELGGEIRAHGRFGTCTVSIGPFTYDIARARRERYPHPGALPEVEPAPVAEDLHRRDFTVNAMAVALTGSARGELIALPGALEDLDEHRLRVLHERSFIDDPTRMLRLARYAARLGFDPEPATARLAEEAVGAGALDTVSGERIGAELRLLARQPRPLAALAWLHRLGLDRAIDPCLQITDLQPARAALELLPAGERPDRLIHAVALRSVIPARRRALLDRLAFPAADRDAILAIAGQARELAHRLAAAGRPSEIGGAAGPAEPETVALAGALGAEAQARQWLERLRHVRLEIGGEDLAAAGIPRGPAIGLGLRAALAAKLDGEAPDREAELARAICAARREAE